MAKDPKKRQKALARKAAKRKKRRAAVKTENAMPSVDTASRWPFLDCRIAEWWRDTNQLTQVLVVRGGASGPVIAASFLLDLACLGAKGGFARWYPSFARYRGDLLPLAMERMPLVKCEPSLAAKVVHEAIAYARSLGIEPHKDARKALPFLRGAHPENCEEEIPLGGPDGKPMFVSGPRDDIRKITAALDRTVGPGNYQVVLIDEGAADFFS